MSECQYRFHCILLYSAILQTAADLPSLSPVQHLWNCLEVETLLCAGATRSPLSEGLAEVAAVRPHDRPVSDFMISLTFHLHLLFVALLVSKNQIKRSLAPSNAPAHRLHLLHHNPIHSSTALRQVRILHPFSRSFLSLIAQSVFT